MSSPSNGKKSKIFYVSRYLFIANNFIFLTNIKHMRNVLRNGRNAYEYRILGKLELNSHDPTLPNLL